MCCDLGAFFNSIADPEIGGLSLSAFLRVSLCCVSVSVSLSLCRSLIIVRVFLLFCVVLRCADAHRLSLRVLVCRHIHHVSVHNIQSGLGLAKIRGALSAVVRCVLLLFLSVLLVGLVICAHSIVRLFIAWFRGFVDLQAYQLADVVSFDALAFGCFAVVRVCSSVFPSQPVMCTFCRLQGSVFMEFSSQFHGKTLCGANVRLAQSRARQHGIGVTAVVVGR